MDKIVLSVLKGVRLKYVENDINGADVLYFRGKEAMKGRRNTRGCHEGD